MLLYFLLIAAFGIIALISVGVIVYSLLKKKKQILIIATVFFLIGSICCVYSVFMYSKRAIQYVKSKDFQEDTRTGSEIIGQTIGSTSSGISNGLSNTLDDEAINNLASKSATIFGKVTKTIASNMDSSLGSKNIYLDKSLENSGLELGRAEEGYHSKTNDLKIFIEFKKDFKGKLSLKNYDQKGKAIDVVYKPINAKAGKEIVETFSFSNSDLGLTTYFVLSMIE